MKASLLCLAVLATMGLCCPAGDEVYRVLTSQDGKEMKAWIRKVENDQVTFRREDGKIFTIPISRLSVDDQTELKKMQTEKAGKAVEAAPEAKVNKRLYPRGLAEMKTACAHIRDVTKALERVFR